MNCALLMSEMCIDIQIRSRSQLSHEDHELLYVDIAGVTFAISLPTGAWQAAVAERYAAFPGARDAAWHVTVANDPSLTVTSDPWIRHDSALTTFRISDAAGRFDLAAHQAEVSVPSAERAGAGLDRVLAYICMQALPRERAGLLLHAAGVAMGGLGYVFAGPSGAGKTTVARLADGRADVLVDENVIVRLGADGLTLHSTPFWGQSTPLERIQRVNRQLPLGGIYLLAHAPHFELHPLTPGQAVMALLTTEKVAIERAESAAAWLATAEQLVSRAPICRLEFCPTAGLWAFLAERQAR